MKKVRLYACVCIAMILFSVSCTKIETRELEEQEGPVIEQESWESEILSSKNGRLTSHIRYNHMFQYEKEKVYRFNNGFEVDFFDEDGKHVSFVKADSGILQENSEHMEAHGNVEVISDTGAVLYTEKLFWNQAAKRIYTDVPSMVVRAEGDTLYCKGFESDLDLSVMEFYQPQGVSNRRLDLDFEKRLKPDVQKKDTLAAEAPDTLSKANPDSLSTVNSDSLNKKTPPVE